VSDIRPDESIRTGNTAAHVSIAGKQNLKGMKKTTSI
jgi:hypothetical protein